MIDSVYPTLHFQDHFLTFIQYSNSGLFYKSSIENKDYFRFSLIFFTLIKIRDDENPIQFCSKNEQIAVYIDFFKNKDISDFSCYTQPKNEKFSLIFSSMIRPFILEYREAHDWVIRK